jgi:hypothetical protein
VTTTSSTPRAALHHRDEAGACERDRTEEWHLSRERAPRGEDEPLGETLHLADLDDDEEVDARSRLELCGAAASNSWRWTV